MRHCEHGSLRSHLSLAVLQLLQESCARFRFWVVILDSAVVCCLESTSLAEGKLDDGGEFVVGGMKIDDRY